MDVFIENIETSSVEENRLALEILIEKFGKGEKREDFLCDITCYIKDKEIKGDLINALIEPFDKNDDGNAVFIETCRSFVCSRECVRYLGKNMQNLSDVIYLLSEAFEKRKQVNYGLVAENILFAFDYDLTNEDIDELLINLKIYDARTRDEDVSDIEAYLESKRVFHEDEYEKPYWVSLEEGENISLLTQVRLGKDPETDMDVKFEKLLEEDSQFFFEFIKKVKGDEDQPDSFFYSDLTPEVKKSIKDFLVVSTQTESEEAGIPIGSPQRVWGPSNSFKNKGCSSGPDGEGECRMLQCECLTFNENDDEDVYDGEGLTWFHGKCDKCKSFIRDLSHALRFPKRDGGWHGCYCCFECLINDNEMFTPEIILVGIMKNNINRTGIMDRSSFC